MTRNQTTFLGTIWWQVHQEKYKDHLIKIYLNSDVGEIIHGKEKWLNVYGEDYEYYGDEIGSHGYEIYRINHYINTSLETFVEQDFYCQHGTDTCLENAKKEIDYLVNEGSTNNEYR